MFALSPAGLLGAQQPLSYEQFEEKAWADGKIDAAERAQFALFSERARLAAARTYATKNFATKEIEPAVSEKMRHIAGRARPWVPMTAEKANREVEPDARKARWHHSAFVDYNGDGVMEIARLSHNGKGMAVILEYTQPKVRQVVIYQTDQIHPDVEIYAAGRRVMMNWPDLGHKVLFLHAGQPSVVQIGD